MNILIRLHRGYGLGDSTQFSVVLQHVVKYYPDWAIDFCCDYPYRMPGIRNAFDWDHGIPSHRYDQVIDVAMYDNTGNWIDKPNTRAVACLYERFGIQYAPTRGRYKVYESSAAFEWADAYLESLGCKAWTRDGRGDTCWNVVACHFSGKTNPQAKDLPVPVRMAVAKAIEEHGCYPLMLGYDTPNGGSIEHLYALISRCAAFIGIDSGPGKVASATDTPSLIVWTGHHPLRMHDPAPNTIHLVPEDHMMMDPLNGSVDKQRYFEKAYRHWTYSTAVDGIERNVRTWLGGVL